MNRKAPPGGEAATWKGLVIIGGAVLVGLAVTASFGKPTTSSGGRPKDTEQPRARSTVTNVTVPASTSTTMPLRDPKEVKVVVANGTSSSGGSKKIIDALKPGCYVVQPAVDATTKVKAEKRATTTVYSTPGYEREAAQITTRLGLQTTANAALPPDLPIPKTGVPSYNVLVLVAEDLIAAPPPALPPCESSASGSTTSTRRGATTTTTKARTSSTTGKATTTTKAGTGTARTTTT